MRYVVLFVLLVNLCPLMESHPFEGIYGPNSPKTQETCHKMLEISKKMPLVVRALYEPNCDEGNQLDCWIMETLMVQYSTQRLNKLRQMLGCITDSREGFVEKSCQYFRHSPKTGTKLVKDVFGKNPLYRELMNEFEAIFTQQLEEFEDYFC